MTEPSLVRAASTVELTVSDTDIDLARMLLEIDVLDGRESDPAVVAIAHAQPRAIAEPGSVKRKDARTESEANEGVLAVTAASEEEGFEVHFKIPTGQAGAVSRYQISETGSVARSVAGRSTPAPTSAPAYGSGGGRVMVKPLQDRILVELLETEQPVKSGLVIPETAKEKPQEGKVLSIGPGRVDDNGNRVPLDVAEGDVVIFSKYGGTEVKYDGPDLLLLNARDILAVVDRPPHS